MKHHVAGKPFSWSKDGTDAEIVCGRKSKLSIDRGFMMAIEIMSITNSHDSKGSSIEQKMGDMIPRYIYVKHSTGEQKVARN